MFPELSEALACQRCQGATGPAAPGTEAHGLLPLLPANQMLLQMGQLLLALMLNGSGGTPGESGAARQTSPVEPVGASAGTSSNSSPAPSGSLGSGSKVLVIGDSHTAGTFGDELDRRLRASGAQVHTVGSSGASADHFLSGQGTRVGYAEHGVDGKTRKTAAHATPKLEELIAQDRPDVIVVNLGANFRGSGPAAIRQQVQKIGDVARKHGIRLTWVGPPRTREDASNPSSLQKFDEQMEAAVRPYGDYISSAALTPRYAGSDGVHYSGAQGSELAKQWAAGVAERLVAK